MLGKCIARRTLQRVFSLDLKMVVEEDSDSDFLTDSEDDDIDWEER
jgi:hypothetical protein